MVVSRQKLLVNTRESYSGRSRLLEVRTQSHTTYTKFGCPSTTLWHLSFKTRLFIILYVQLHRHCERTSIEAKRAWFKPSRSASMGRVFSDVYFVETHSG